jgi:hypothetical protein
MEKPAKILELLGDDDKAYVCDHIQEQYHSSYASNLEYRLFVLLAFNITRRYAKPSEIELEQAVEKVFG